MLPSGAMSSEYTLNGKIAAVNEVQVFPLAGRSGADAERQGRRHRIQGSDPVYGGYLDGYFDDELCCSNPTAPIKTATDRAIESAKVGVEQAELAVSNTEALLEAGAAAEQDLTKAKQALTQAQAGVAQAEATAVPRLWRRSASVYGPDQQAGKPLAR